MRKFLFVSCVISIIFNIYFIREYIIGKNQQDFLKNLYDVKFVNKTDGIKSFENIILETNPSLYESKKYYFIQTWDTLTSGFYGQIRYMQALDSVVNLYKNENICFLFATEMDKKTIVKYQKDHNIYFKNFIYIYNANDFISSIYTQKQKKYKSHPIQFIVNKNNDILYYKTSLFTDITKDTVLRESLIKYSK